MRSMFILCLVIALVSICFGRKSHNLTVLSWPRDLTSCDQLQVKVGTGEIARAERERILSRSEVSNLQIQGANRGGIFLRGWDRDEYSVKACLVAAGDSVADAESTLSRLSLAVENGRVSLEGSGKGDWIAFFVVHTPPGAMIDLNSTKDAISLRDVSGQIQANTLDGAISVTGGSGTLRLSSRNGAIAVELKGARWESGDLEARTENGIVTLRIPETFESSVRVDGSNKSPMKCLAKQCGQAAKSTWGEPRIAFGDSPPVVRLSTANGAVTVKPSV